MKTEKEIVDAFLEAHNQHDIDSVMSFYAEDATFEFVGFYTIEGKPALRQFEEYDVVFNTKLSFFDYKLEPGRVSYKTTEQNEYFRTFDIDEVYFSSCTTTIRDGLITSLRIELSQESREQVEQVQETFMTWAAKEKPETLAKLMPDGEFIPGKESGLAMMALLREWKAAQA